ncbi:MAG: tetratricopeptide repeat protein [Pseudomonadota bacterium]
MHHDAQGLPLSAASVEAVAAFDHAVQGYLNYAADAGARVAPMLAADPDAPMAQVLAGSFAMLGFRADAVPRAAAAAARAAALPGTAREMAHAAALAAWAAGEPDQALRGWEAILATHPQDVLAFRLHHFVAFWQGSAERMLATAEQVLPRLDPAMPGASRLLGCRAFAHEEAGLYTTAEAYGRAAIEADPSDLWAAHAVAHVFEMQGRRSEGTAWVARLQPHWAQGNNLKHHLWWHEALYVLEQGDHARVLHLYDTGFRNGESALTQAQPDLYIDMQNACSMLFRLRLLGVAAGNRWEELADLAEARIGDAASAFTLPHWMMALTAAGRFRAASRMLDALHDVAAAAPIAQSATLRAAALPACAAVLHHGRGEHDAALDALRPALGNLPRLGGSHAQQDVLAQLFLDSAMQAGRRADAVLLLERTAARHPVPLARRAFYAEAAASLGF